MSLFTRSYDIHNKIINVSISSVPMSNKIQQNRIYVYILYFKSYSISNVRIGIWYQVVSYNLNAKPCISLSSIMTSSNGNIFRVTGHLCREFTGRRWIPGTKASDAELWRFLWSAPKRLGKQSWGWLFETLLHTLWRRCNVSFSAWPFTNKICLDNCSEFRVGVLKYIRDSVH